MIVAPTKILVGVLPEDAENWDDQLLWGMLERISLSWDETTKKWALILTRHEDYPWDDARRGGRTKAVLSLGEDSLIFTMPNSTFTYLDAYTLEVRADHLLQSSF